jgi:D-3-phosphoglycerate dehydrogenase
MPRSGKHRVCVIHKNVPNILTQITGLIADDNVNIENLLNKSRGDYAYTMLDIDEADEAQLKGEIEAIDGIIRVRII